MISFLYETQEKNIDYLKTDTNVEERPTRKAKFYSFSSLQI